MMKSSTRVITAVVATAMMVACPAMAQTTKEKKETSFTDGVNSFIKDLEKAGHELGDAIGFDDRVDGKTNETKIDGTYYMPIHQQDLFNGKEAEELRSTCELAFINAYPDVEIKSVAVPASEWKTKTVKERGKVVGYVQSIECYVLGKDGEEGYINAKFVFTRVKDVGKNYVEQKGKWPLWERTDIIPNSAYRQLSKK